jgi:hypothetical protein
MALHDATGQLVRQVVDLLAVITGVPGEALGSFVGERGAFLREQLIPTAYRLRALGTVTPPIEQALDEAAAWLRTLAVRHFNQTGRFITTLSLMKDAVHIAASDDMREQAEADLRTLCSLKAQNDVRRFAQAGSWSRAEAAISRAREQAQSEDDRKCLDGLATILYNAAAEQANTHAKALCWSEAAAAGRVARRCAPNPVLAWTWDQAVAMWSAMAAGQSSTPGNRPSTTPNRRRARGWPIWAVILGSAISPGVGEVLVALLVIIVVALGTCNSSGSSAIRPTDSAVAIATNAHARRGHV